MGDKSSWLKARKRHKQILVRLKKILSGSAIAALIVGPLIYFGVAAQETAQILEGDLRNKALRESMATPEVKTNQKPIEFSKVEVKKPEKKEDLNLDIRQDKIPEKMQEPEAVTQTASYDTFDEEKTKIASEFNENKEDINIKTIDTDFDGLKEKSVILDEVSIDYGPTEIKQEPDANAAARTALQKYLNTLEEKNNYAVLKDTTKLDQTKQPDVLVISSVVNHNGKWYADFKQYHNMLPVFDGNVKMIFTEKKKLLVLTDNIRRNLPSPEEFTVGTAMAQQSTKELFEWDETKDEVQFINKGYYKEKPAYKVETDVHNPLGQWDVYVNGTDGTVEDLMSDIRTQDDPIPAEEAAPPAEPTPVEEPTPTGEPDPSVQPEEATPAEETDVDTTTEITPPEETPAETPTETPSETPAVTETTTEEPATTEPEIIPETTDETVATPEPEFEILQTLLGQVFGKIYPKTPNDAQEIIPFANEYLYINQNRITTDAQGYFDNPTMSWYSLFLEGPYVTVRDDNATVNADITDQTPEDPFTWDENTASLAAINAFYHTNKIREWAAANLQFEINDNIPVTVNSSLVDDYMNGCGAWYDTRNNTIEIGRGGYQGEIDGIRSPCMNDLNYALSSDIIYHEYAHHIIESVTHLPNIQGAESAAMGEGLTDYFAATINDDSVWGDVITVRTRDLNNTLKYKSIDENGIEISGMTGNAHYDGQIFSGALWDLRTAIGAEATDKLVFNTLYQGRLHYETFMYGMIIEDDDNEDFSDGTPHLIEILEAFENHGIGPGVVNFSGLPIDPAEWTKILEEAGYEGEEDPIYGAWSGAGCHVSGNDLNVWGGACTNTTAMTVLGNINVYESGGVAGVFTIAAAGSVTVNGNLNIYSGTTAAQYARVNVSGNALNVSGNTTVGQTTGNTSYLYVSNSQTATTTGYTYTYANGYIQSYSGGSYVNTGANFYNYGDITAGNTVGTGYITVGTGTAGAFTNYSGGTFQTLLCSTCTSKIDVNGTITMNGGSTGTIAQYSSLEVNTLNIGGTVLADTTLTINGTLNAASTTYDINLISNSAGTYEGNLVVGSTGTLYVDYFTIGATSGGNFTNNGFTYVYQDMTVANWGNITNTYLMYLGSQSMFDLATPNSTNLTMNEGSALSNSAPNSTYAFQVWGNITLNNNITWTNTGTAFVRNALYMAQSGSNHPVITNTGTIRVEYNGTNQTYANNDLYVYGESVINNNGGEIRICDDVFFGNTNGDNDAYLPTINNAGGNFYVGWNGTSSIGTTNNTLNIRYDAYLNITSGTFVVDSSSTINTDGMIILDPYAANAYNLPKIDNAGTLSSAFMQIGNTLNYLTTVTNKSGGTLTVNYTGTTYKGIIMNQYSLLDNKSGATALDINAQVELIGNSASYKAEINNDATSGVTINDLWMYQYGLLDNNGTMTIEKNANMDVDDNDMTCEGGGSITIADTIWMDGLTTTIYNGTALGSGCTINIGNSTTGATGADLIMNNRSSIINYSASDINIYDDVMMGGEMGDDSHIDNWGNFDIIGTTTNELKLQNANYIINEYTGRVDTNYTSPSSDSDGRTFIFTDSYITNYGQFLSNRIDIGNGTTTGGTFTNDYDSANDPTLPGGTVDIKSSNDTALRIYRGVYTNTNNSGHLNVENGGIWIDGASGDPGFFNHYSDYQTISSPPEISKLIAMSYGTAYIYAGIIQAGTCYAYENVANANGSIEIYGTSTLECVYATYIGDGSVIDPGKIWVEGNLEKGTIFIYEDTTGPDDDIELHIHTTGYVDVANISMGNATYDGGQLENLNSVTISNNFFATNNANIRNGYAFAGGTIYDSPFSVGNNISLQSDATKNTYFWNFGDVTAQKLLLGDVATNIQGGYFLNYSTAATSLTISSTGSDAIVVNDEGGTGTKQGTLENVATLNCSGTITLNGFSATYPANLINGSATMHTANLFPSYLTIDGYGVVDNYAKISVTNDIEMTSSSNAKIFNNEASGTVGAKNLYLRVDSTYNNKASSSTSIGIMTTLDRISTTMDNYGTFTSSKLAIGIHKSFAGGNIYNRDGSIFDITSATSDCAVVYGGSIIRYGGSSGIHLFRGNLLIEGDSHGGPGLVQTSFTPGQTFITQIGSLYINDDGQYQSNGESETIKTYSTTGDVDTTSTGLLSIGSTGEFTAVGTATFSGNSSATNLLNNGIYNSTYLTSVVSTGVVRSDITSSFTYTSSGLTSAGDVEMWDDVTATTVTQTGGSLTLGQINNVGISTISGKTTISNGYFYTYNDADMHDMEVTGATALAYFKDSQTNGNCNTDIHGYLDIKSSGYARVECKTTSPAAVNVHSGSPGGTTLVEGTLVLNTNLITEDMIVGDGVSVSGTVTHDTVSNLNPYITDATSVVFNLSVSNNLTINSNGTFDVSAKSRYPTSGTAGVNRYFGGTYGGKGMSTVMTGVAEYGYLTSPETNWNTFYSDFGRGGRYIDGTGVDAITRLGGGKMKIAVGNTLNIASGGTIKANGEAPASEPDSGGSGGSIIVRANILTGAGNISAIGGNYTGGSGSKYAGGGGRIYIDYADKSGFSGTVLAYGGRGYYSVLVKHAGTGTIFYRNLDDWENQKDGVLLIDSGNRVIDVDLDGGAPDIIDATKTPPLAAGNQDYIDVESIQLEDSSVFAPQGGATCAGGQCSYTQQCLIDTTSSVLFTQGQLLYNRHDTNENQEGQCHATPDPPSTQFLNNSSTGAQTAQPGYKTDTLPHVTDKTPAYSAIHTDGTLDKSNYLITPTHSVFYYNIQINDSVADLTKNVNMTCDIDTEPLSAAEPNTHRTLNHILSTACGLTLSNNTTYYWRIRFMEDQDGNTGTTTDQFWGLWSQTNQFTIDEGGLMWISGCTTPQAFCGTADTICLGNTPAYGSTEKILLPTDQMDYENCTIKLTTTVLTNVFAHKTDTLKTSGGKPFPDLVLGEYDIGETGETVSELGFRISDRSLPGTMDSLLDPDNSKNFDSDSCIQGVFGCWHVLKNTVANPPDPADTYNIIQNLAALTADESFKFWLGAFSLTNQEAGSYTANAILLLTSPP